ncbi:adaptor protein MecA [Heyndrickxia sp. NPDC080065]|uniref:adaptor protein MecA n=1 Tax=Heyndrickxia sp. NPDC080065 TaxID=3390568 RepID=UPI003D0203D5
MEIERINENTVKFYISYVDIEERGFNREEIWYDRERSEELFWEMMDEIHNEEEFVPEGPLWIQVQALDKGLEVLVTKAQLSNDGQRFELPIPDEKLKELPINERIEEFLDEHFQSKHLQDDEDDILEFMMSFKDFEDVISLSKRSGLDNILTKLFSINNKYYLYVEFPDELFEEEEIDNILSILLEYGEESSFTVHRLQEYGNVIIDKDVFSTINQHFN